MNKIQDLINEDFIIFTFSGITTYLNNRGEEKKKPIGMPTWKNITKDNFLDYTKESDKGIALITGVMSGITVIDFDDISVYNDLIIKCPEIKNIRTIKTKNGIHLYCKYDKNIKTTTNAFNEYDKIDIRNDDAIVFCPPTKYKLVDGTYAEYIDMGGDILPVPKFLLDNMKQNNILIPETKKETKKESKKEIKDNVTEEMVHLEFIEKSINDGYLNHKATSKSYDDWRDIGFIIKHTSQSQKAFELFCEFSQINDKLNPTDKPLYDPEYTRKFWDTIKQTDKKPLTIKSLKYIVKEQEQQKEVIFCANDKEAADYIYEKIKDNLVYCKNILYYKKNNIWINDEKELKISLRDYVLNTNIYKTNEKSVHISYSQNVSNAKNIVEAIIGIVVNKSDNSFYEKFLTSTKTKLCFNNGFLNLKTKEFTLWENMTKDNEVFSTFVISRDYNSERDEKTIKLIKENIFHKIFGEDMDRALHFYSRAMAGHIEDKVFGLFIGSRNCGKGVLENFFKQTFQNYITTVNAEVFLCERISDGGDSAKKLSWMLDLEFSRLTFTQECKFDNTNKNVKIDGNKIKKLASGGDTINARKNFKDEREFKTQTTLTINSNDFPPISPLDTMETCTSFSSVKQFKTQDAINKRKEEGALELELSMYDVADPDIKNKCSTTLWADALIHLIMDSYVNKPVAFINQFLDNEDETNLITNILSAFEITKNKEDKVTNEELKVWCDNNDISLGKKLKPFLKGWGCLDFRTGTKRGIQGIKLKKVEEK